jgi:hypothetical protein
MVMRFLLGGATFSCLFFFGLGSLRGDLREAGLLYAIVGLCIGVAVVALTRGVVLSPRSAWRWARVCFAIAVALLVWGFVALISGQEPVTGTGSVARGAVVAETILMVSTAPAFAGFLVLGMRSR